MLRQMREFQTWCLGNWFSFLGELSRPDIKEEQTDESEEAVYESEGADDRGGVEHVKEEVEERLSSSKRETSPRKARYIILSLVLSLNNSSDLKDEGRVCLLAISL